VLPSQQSGASLPSSASCLSGDLIAGSGKTVLLADWALARELELL